VGWGSHTRTRHRRLPVLALTAALAVAGVGAGCGGAGSGSKAADPPSGTPPVEIPLTGGAKLRVAGLPKEWVSLGSTPLASSAPAGAKMLSFVKGQPEDLVAGPKSLVSFEAVPADAAGRAFVARTLAGRKRAIGHRQIHVVPGPGAGPTTATGSAVFKTGDYYIVASWTGVDQVTLEPAFGQTDVVSG